MVKRYTNLYMEQNRPAYRTAKMAQWLQASKSGYYAWRKRASSLREQEGMMEKKECPCKRKTCERHGNCDACRAYHAKSKRKRACEREKKHSEDDRLKDCRKDRKRIV